VTTLRLDGKICRRTARAPASSLKGKLETDRVLGRIVKLSFFKAACDLTGTSPAWGALTGIRPAKLVTRMLDEGKTLRQADARLRDVYFVTEVRRRLVLDAAAAGREAREALRPEDVSVYVGIPFCPTRCAYCSFVSQSVQKSLKLIGPYLVALAREIGAAGRALAEAGLRVKSLYMGGGTPTTLSAAQMDALLRQLESAFDLSGCAETTVEAGRPDTITAEKLLVLRDHGVTRISVNPQTMRDEVLAAMGRRHTAAEVLGAMELTRRIFPGDVNMDLLAGLPKDPPEGFRNSLDTVLALTPENVTVHTLSLKRGSRLMLEGGALPGAAAVSDMLDYAGDRLRAEDYAPYYLYRQKFMSGNFENVGWTRPGHTGLYNIYIMEELHTILSLGGGGITKLVDAQSGLIRRVCNPKYSYEYLDRIEKIIRDKALLPAFVRERR
jgi:oxygen-independent coproporphyrinogen-3 oxidase